MAITTWELKDHIYQGNPATTGAAACVGQQVTAEPVPPPSTIYLLANTADGALHPITEPFPFAIIDATGQFDIAALPCAVAGTQQPTNTPWRIRVPSPEGGIDVWQGVPPTSAGTLKLVDLVNGVNGASGWVLVS